MADAPAGTVFDAAWLVARRWFRSKGRPIAAVDQVDLVPIDGRSALLVLGVEYGDGARDRYLVPAVGDGWTWREPEAGDGTWSALLASIAAGAELRGAHGRFHCTALPALADLLPSGATAAEALPERRLAVEQSNTSVVFGDRLILKLYRRVEPGSNPDLEVSEFLTAVGFADTPAVAGEIAYLPDDAPAAAAAMLQELVPAVGDAWAAMLRALATDRTLAFEIATRVAAVTARLHAALASRPEESSFPARPATRADGDAWHAAAEDQLAAALDAVAGAAHERLVRLAPAVRARFAQCFRAVSDGAAVSRIHGDYHLGQLLARPDGGFSVIDFEGEPARPLAERRAVTSPLRDVAGMLRSLDYAARTAAGTSGLDADGWLAPARAAFIAAYGGIGDGESALLDAFELEKACYEVRYEADNRPDWLWLPLDAVERLVARA